jgi:hypothetical protein
MKTTGTIIAACLVIAASGCGVDWGAVVADAHDLYGQGKEIADAKCQSGTTDAVCIKVNQGAVAVGNLIQLADFALFEGKDLEDAAKTAWVHAKAFADSVKALLGIKSKPAGIVATAAVAPAGAEVAVTP